MLNLLPWREQALQAERKQIFIILTACLIITTILLLIERKHMVKQLEHCQQKYRLQHKHKKNVEQQLQCIQRQLAQQLNLDRKLALIKRQLTVIKIIDSVCSLLPAESYLLSLELSDQALILTGISVGMGHQTVVNFVNTLKSKTKALVEIRQLINQTDKKTAFKIHVFLENKGRNKKTVNDHHANNNS